MRDLPAVLSLPGHIALPDNATWRVGVLTDGRVEKVYANLGDYVHKGQILARMHSHDVHDARAAYQTALADRAKLEAQVHELGLDGRVTMPGRVPEADLHRAFHDANVLVLPSIVDQRGDTEGLGVVLLEALSYRIPVIGSAIGGITDIIVDGDTGLLVPPQDPAAIAGAIARIATDPAFAERLAVTGSRRVREQFGWDAIIAAWQECYAAALRKNPRA